MLREFLRNAHLGNLTKPERGAVFAVIGLMVYNDVNDVRSWWLKQSPAKSTEEMAVVEGQAKPSDT